MKKKVLFFHILDLIFQRLSKLQRDYMLKKQEKENKYHKFVRNNLILKQGFLLKRKVTLFNWTFRLVLTCFENNSLGKGFSCQTTYVSTY
jgi:hypothetical protein